jgi:hypothetical protein
MIHTIPDGAQVLVNGKVFCAETPCQYWDKGSSDTVAVVSLVKEGYYTEMLTLTKDRFQGDRWIFLPWAMIFNYMYGYQPEYTFPLVKKP